LLLPLLAGCPNPKTDADTGGGTGAGGDDTADTDTALPGPTGLSKAQPVCGPTDGVGMGFFVGLDAEGCGNGFADAGHVRISLWSVGGDPLAAGTYAFTTSTGVAWYDPGTGIEEQANGGEVVIASWDADGAQGTYRITLGSGEVLEGTFTAPLCEQSGPCG
jgi:hypothetical protein